MQELNDDMDLFRRAAEDYPLNTDSADFNEVLKKLAAEQSKKIDKRPAKKKNYKSLLLLLLLIPIGLILNNNSNISEKRSGRTDKKNETKISKTPSPENSIANTTIVKPVLVTKNKPSSKNAAKIKSNFQSNSAYKQATRLISIPVTANNNNQFIQNEPSLIVKANTDELAGKIEKNLLLSVNNIRDETNNIKNSDETPLSIILNDRNKEVKKSDTSITNQGAINKLKKKNQKRNENGLYAGIIFAPDISTIKFQRVKNIGVSFGLLVGYQFSKKISVESGILWDKKFYYSTGEYFNTKEIHIPQHIYVKVVEGLCKMIEFPVTVKYDFKQSGKTKFSTSAGLSSYFMKRETYDYTMEKYGQQYPYYADYKRASTKLFAVMNVSVGYNRTLGKVGTLRIEPYLKIPLKGVGIGSLPITSTGLNIGITKKLF